MAKKTNVAGELKALGSELAEALKKMGSSKEFKDLEGEIVSSVKKVSSSLVKGFKAASESESAGKIKKRVGRVVKISAKKGGEEALKAQQVARVKLKKVNKAFRKLAKKLGR